MKLTQAEYDFLKQTLSEAREPVDWDLAAMVGDADMVYVEKSREAHETLNQLVDAAEIIEG